MNSLLLDQTAWDLVVDSAGNIAVCSEPYRAAQDVACTLRLFKGEAYYDANRGIPYRAQILGHIPPIALLKSLWTTAALKIPGVASAVAYISGINNRVVTGQVQITDSIGTVTVVTTGPSSNPPGYAITDTGQPGLTDTGQNMVTS